MNHRAANPPETSTRIPRRRSTMPWNVLSLPIGSWSSRALISASVSVPSGGHAVMGRQNQGISALSIQRPSGRFKRTLNATP